MKKVTFYYQPPTAGDHKVGILAEFTNWAIIPMDNQQGVYQKDFWLAEGQYQYKLIIDGVWTPDPANPMTISDSFGGWNSFIEVEADKQIIDPAVLPYYQEIPLNLADDFPVPEWVRTGIVYQIFPDRFCRANPANDPDFSEWYYANSRTPPSENSFLKTNQEYFHLIADWQDVSGLTQSPFLPAGKPDWWSFYGGDIAGVKSKLPYLAELGITIIYFNPLWLSKSNHKYDAADFRKIDPHFGTDTEFRDFVSEAHCLGMRIILDIALNHTGETFWAFQDCRIKGAASPYWNWYDWHKWPLPDPLPEDFQPKEYYQCWWGIKDMPDLNYDLLRQHPEENEITDITQAQPNWAMINHILDAMQSWLTEMDIDGFRLDVPNEVPFWFWQLFRQRIKALKPDAWLVGELWANPLQWVSDKYFDSVMNYAHFKDPVIDYFIKGSLDTGSFIQKLYYGLTNSPASSCYAMMNLLSSHDTWRIREIALNSLSIHDGMPNSDLALGKSEFANPLISGSDASLSLVDRVQRDIALNKQKLAILFQMTYPGAPHIYYGDEIGMRGAADPDNRRPMNWNWQTNAESREIHAYYQRLIRLRKRHPILQTGLIKFIYHPELLIFHRYDVCECIVVLINNTDSAVSYHCPETPVEIYHPEAACPSPDIVLQPYSARIYKYIP